MKTILLGNRLSISAGVLSLLVLSALSETFGATRDSQAIAVFINEGRAKIQVNVISEDKKEKIIMLFPPEAIERTLFGGGQVKLYTPSDNNVSGRLLFTLSLPTPRSAPEFFEQGTRTFYFRIAGGKIILVRPRDVTPK